MSNRALVKGTQTRPQLSDVDEAIKAHNKDAVAYEAKRLGFGIKPKYERGLLWYTNAETGAYLSIPGLVTGPTGIETVSPHDVYMSVYLGSSWSQRQVKLAELPELKKWALETGREVLEKYKTETKLV